MTKKAIVIGINSGIGSAIAGALMKQRVQILGSYRSAHHLNETLKANSLALDLKQPDDINHFAGQIKHKAFYWDYLLLCSATMEPIGAFETVNIDQWVESVNINLLNQMRLLHALLPLRNKTANVKPTVLSLAGGGVNGAPVNYSAYTLAKIGLIKMTELLSAEMPDVHFVNMGPGWVNTPIHQQTLNAGVSAGQAFAQTQERLRNNAFVPMQTVVNCALTLLQENSAIYSGRNFSAANDRLDLAELNQQLENDPDMYKLRRYKNQRHTNE